MQDPPIWQRVLAALAYLLPWSDAFSFGRGLFGLFPALQWLGVPILPIALLEQAVPFGGLVLFLVLFLAVVRNSKVPYVIRFNVLQAIFPASRKPFGCSCKVFDPSLVGISPPAAAPIPEATTPKRP